MLITVSTAPASTPSARRPGEWVSGTIESSQCQTNQNPTATPGADDHGGMTIPSAVRAGKRSRRPKRMATPCRADDDGERHRKRSGSLGALDELVVIHAFLSSITGR